MAWHERDYNRDEETGFDGSPARRRGLPGFSFGSVVTWLIAINCVVFLLDSVFFNAQRGSGLAPSSWGGFTVVQGVHRYQIWRFLTYQFVHANVFHILFNMIVLYFLGPMLESWWGGRRFLAFYLLCGACGALLFIPVALSGVIPANLGTSVVGASGSIYGLLVAGAMLFPRQRVMLMFPPIPMSMRTVALLLLGLNFVMVLAGSPDAGGATAHLGGALLGFVLVKLPGALNFADWKPLGDSRDRLARRREKLAAAQHRLDEEVDRILAKVKDHGLHSLTNREKKTLRDATEKQRRAG